MGRWRRDSRRKIGPNRVASWSFGSCHTTERGLLDAAHDRQTHCACVTVLLARWRLNPESHQTRERTTIRFGAFPVIGPSVLPPFHFEARQ